jgi:hypothetical protein
MYYWLHLNFVTGGKLCESVCKFLRYWKRKTLQAVLAKYKLSCTVSSTVTSKNARFRFINLVNVTVLLSEPSESSENTVVLFNKLLSLILYDLRLFQDFFFYSH